MAVSTYILVDTLLRLIGTTALAALMLLGLYWVLFSTGGRRGR